MTTAWAAVAVHLEDVDVVGEPVEERAGETGHATILTCSSMRRC
jgi:hypothetical protein